MVTETKNNWGFHGEQSMLVPKSHAGALANTRPNRENTKSTCTTQQGACFPWVQRQPQTTSSNIHCLMNGPLAPRVRPVETQFEVNLFGRCASRLSRPTTSCPCIQYSCAQGSPYCNHVFLVCFLLLCYEVRHSRSSTSSHFKLYIILGIRCVA